MKNCLEIDLNIILSIRLLKLKIPVESIEKYIELKENYGKV
jgi:hypothetical protein